MSQSFRDWANGQGLSWTSKEEFVATAYAARTRQQSAEVARTHKVLHGDHYAAYYDPSNDGPEIANAILAIEV
jgi:hypothetical protein